MSKKKPPFTPEFLENAQAIEALGVPHEALVEVGMLGHTICMLIAEFVDEENVLRTPLDDLVAELNSVHGQRPVLFGVSFGAGLILEFGDHGFAAAGIA